MSIRQRIIFEFSGQFGNGSTCNQEFLFLSILDKTRIEGMKMRMPFCYLQIKMSINRIWH